MIAVFKKELTSYFKGITGYLFAAFLLFFVGIYVMAYNLSGYYSNFEYSLDSVTFVFLILIPLLSMRCVAEERKQKTDQLLYSLPLKLSDVIIGKFLAMITVLGVPVLVLSLYPLILSQFGTVSFGPAYGTIFAFFLLGCSLLSIGLFISSLTENQIAAAIISLVVMILIYFLDALTSFVSTDAQASLSALIIGVIILGTVIYFFGKNLMVSVVFSVIAICGLLIWHSINSAFFSGLFGTIISKLSLFSRFSSFVSGVFDLSAIVYFISVIVVFIFLSIQEMEKRRWSE
ncbi:MAG: ABC transporter permease subunit [Sphaerochaetaceae bacterium]|nr:ABC transporter permease subunit [Sphaerochaetaceae bacterium]